MKPLLDWLGTFNAEARVQVLEGLYTGNILGPPKIGLVIVGRNPSTSEIPAGISRMMLVADGQRVLDSISQDIIADAVRDLHMVVMVMVDWDSEVAASCIAKVLRSQGILLTVAFQSVRCGSKNRPYVDALIHTNHERMPSLADICRGICDPLCMQDGVCCLDFEDARHLLVGHDGCGAFCFASCGGVNGAADAARRAVVLLGQNRLQSATAVLVAISAPPNLLRRADTKNALQAVEEFRSPETAPILYSMTPAYGAHRDEITVSLLVNGIQR